MSNLKPEKRFDRLGRLVTRWVKGTPSSAKPSILGSVHPVIPDATTQYLTEAAAADAIVRSALLKDIKDSLNKESEAQHALAAMNGTTKDELLSTYRIGATIRTLFQMEVETLQIIRDSPHEKTDLIRFLYATSSEAELREEIHYMSHAMAKKEASRYKGVMFDPIKKVLDVDDLSIYPRGSIDYETVLSTLQVMATNWGIRTDFDHQWPEDDVEEGYINYLLETLRGHPEKAAKLNSLIIQREVPLEDIDPVLLEEYLDNETPALSDGML